MEMEDTFSLNLTPSQIEWILAQLNSPTKRLYPNPFQPTSARQIRETLDEARTALREHGLIEEDASGRLTLDATVAGLVGALGFSDVVLQLSLFRERDLDPEVLRYFSAEGLLVEQTATAAGEVSMTALRAVEVLRARLWDCLGLIDQSAPASGGFHCSAKDFSDIPYTLAGDGESAAIAQLVELGADSRFASDLISAMASPLWQATLQLVTLDSDSPEGVRLLGKLTLIEGIYGLWAVITDLESTPARVNVVPCNAAQARSYVSELIDVLVS